MHCKLVMTLAIATAAAVPGFASATGMFCQPGQDWTTVDSGTITGEGWSVVNFTKPEGGAMRITWMMEGFDDGPATAGVVYGPEPDHISHQAFLYTDEHEQHAEVHVHGDTLDVDRKVSAGNPVPGLPRSTEIALELGPSFADEDNHVLQYAAGEDSDGHAVRWRVLVDDCLDIDRVDVAVEQGSEAAFLTPDDFQGTLNAQARVHAPVIANNGAVAMVEATATVEAANVPYLNTWWSNDAGNIELDGPGSLTLGAVSCFDWGDQTICRDWGSTARPALVPGSYRFDVTGLTDPTQNPTGSTQGPYVTVLSTRLPGGNAQ